MIVVWMPEKWTPDDKMTSSVSPINIKGLLKRRPFRVPSGIRTHDIQNHNLTL